MNTVSYDLFTNAFVAKISEYKLMQLPYDDRTSVVDDYMRRAISVFKKNCKYDLFSTRDDEERCFNIEIPQEDIDEILNIVSEGMVVQWLKPYLYNQEVLENAMNTKDFSTYSPAELLLRIGNAHKEASDNFTNLIREYSYNHGRLSELHL